MSELELSVNPANKVKRKYVKTGLNSRKYKEFVKKNKGLQKESIEVQKMPICVQKKHKCEPVVNKYVDTSDPKYHDFDVHLSFLRCNRCQSVLHTDVLLCRFCVRKDRKSD